MENAETRPRNGGSAKTGKRPPGKLNGKAPDAKKRGRSAKASATAEAHEANQAPRPDAPFTVHENPMPDADEFADEEGFGGTDNTTAARASALRAILIKGEDAAKIEWRIKRQWPHLKDTAAAIVEAAQRTAAQWAPGKTRTIGGMQKIVTSIDALNDRFAMIEVPGQATCVAQRSDALFMSRDDFKSRMGTSVIVTGVNKDGTVEAKDAAKIWMGDNRRRTASKIVFTSRDIDHECFNLWTGFGVTPRAGSCKLIRRHIWEVICARDSTKYKAFVRLLAWQTQNIGCASRIVVDLQSDLQQVGKGVLLEKILRPMYGLHGVFTADSDKIFGRFNDLIRGKAYTAFDEACFAGKRDTADKIKSISATESTPIEGKNLPVIECPVALNIFMATNHGHAAHIEWGDMRYWILKVSEHRRGDRSYWEALRKEINNGGVEAFLHNLLARNVSKFDPQRDVPRDNDEHRANKRASDPGNPALWLLDCLDNGIWLGSEAWEGDYSPDNRIKSTKGALKLNESGKKLLPAFILKSYRTWAKEQGPYIHTPPNDKFWRLLTSFGIDGKKCGGTRARVVPDEDALRAKIEEWLGTVGTVGKVANDVTTKTAQKDASANISAGFSGESAIRLSPTDPKAKKLDTATTYQGTVGGDSRGDSRGDGRGLETAKRGQSGTVEGTVVSGATVPASTAFKSNGKHGSNGGSETEGGNQAPRGTPSSKPYQSSVLSDDGDSDNEPYEDNDAHNNSHALNGVGGARSAPAMAGKTSALKVAL